MYSPAFIGLDPGVSTGIVLGIYNSLHGKWTIHAFQCTADSAPWLLEQLICTYNVNFVAAESFVTSNGAGAKGKDADTTKKVLYQAEFVIRDHNLLFHQYPAGIVKPWATDKRLAKIGFPLGPKFRDARDAGRHMLYSAVKFAQAPDPLR